MYDGVHSSQTVFTRQFHFSIHDPLSTSPYPCVQESIHQQHQQHNHHHHHRIQTPASITAPLTNAPSASRPQYTHSPITAHEQKQRKPFQRSNPKLTPKSSHPHPDTKPNPRNPTSHNRPSHHETFQICTNPKPRLPRLGKAGAPSAHIKLPTTRVDDVTLDDTAVSLGAPVGSTLDVLYGWYSIGGILFRRLMSIGFVEDTDSSWWSVVGHWLTGPI
jgi:hypothetical protein